MKKSHRYDEIPSFEIRCPHCGRWNIWEGDIIIGFILLCPECIKDFEIGKYVD